MNKQIHLCLCDKSSLSCLVLKFDARLRDSHISPHLCELPVDVPPAPEPLERILGPLLVVAVQQEVLRGLGAHRQGEQLSRWNSKVVRCGKRIKLNYIIEYIFCLIPE